MASFLQPGRSAARLTCGIDDQIGGQLFGPGVSVTDDYARDSRLLTVDEVLDEPTARLEADAGEVSDSSSDHVFEQRSRSAIDREPSRAIGEEVALVVEFEVARSVDHQPPD